MAAAARCIARFPFERTAISPPARTARLDGRAVAGQLPLRRSAGPRIFHRKSLARGLLSRVGDQGKAAMVTFKIERGSDGTRSTIRLFGSVKSEHLREIAH